MKYLIYATITLAFAFTSYAQDKPKSYQKIDVKGNCEMCKKRIEKAALSVKGVRSASWSTDEKKLDIYLNPKKTNLDAVEKAVAKTGHDTQNIKAEDNNYKNLHSCCQYER